MVRSLAIGLLAAAPAAAGQGIGVSIGGTKVALPAPPGTCFLDEGRAADRDRLALVRRFNVGRNDVLAMFADCRVLDAFRARGAALAGRAGVGTYLAPASAAGGRYRVSRARFVAATARQLEDKRLLAGAHEETRRRARKLTGAVSLRGNVDLGILHRDRSAVFIGVVQDWAAEGDEPQRMVVVTGMTLVRQTAVTLQLSAPYENEKSVQETLARQRANLRRLIAAN